MSHDIVADALNQVMNAKRAGKNELVVERYSKFLLNVLSVAKKHKYLAYELEEESKKLKIRILSLNECKAIKPRFDIRIGDIEKYMRRFLPARDFGIIIISSSKGLVTHKEAYEKNIGGSLIAYFY